MTAMAPCTYLHFFAVFFSLPVHFRTELVEQLGWAHGIPLQCILSNVFFFKSEFAISPSDKKENGQKAVHPVTSCGPVLSLTCP